MRLAVRTTSIGYASILCGYCMLGGGIMLHPLPTVLQVTLNLQESEVNRALHDTALLSSVLEAGL